MIRFISHLLGKPYEVCKSCETLKQQLEFVNSEKRELLNTLISLVNPKVLESPATVIQPIQVSAGLFSRRRAAAEARDRESARIEKLSPNIGRSDIGNDIKSNSQTTMTTEELEDSLAIGGNE